MKPGDDFEDLRLLTAEQVADILAVTPETLPNWRYLKREPASYAMGKRAIRYLLQDVRKWQEQALHFDIIIAIFYSPGAPTVYSNLVKMS